MDSNIVVALASIGGVIVGIIGTYFAQNIIAERQRKWALEDEGRRNKRELLNKRLDILEEAIKIMMNEISCAVSKESGEPIWEDADKAKEQGIRLQSIRGEAWIGLVALGSRELTQHWHTVSKAYWELSETGTVDCDSWNNANKSYAELVKLTDTMRSQV